MPIVQELSFQLKQQRVAMGISQQRLAELAGMSRVTINQLETGRLTNLSLISAEKLANVLGFGLGVTGVRTSRSDLSTALETGSRTASVSYAEVLPTEILRSCIVNGVIAPNYVPQLRALLDEAPVGLLTKISHQVELEDDVSARSSWQNMRRLALALGCNRGIWS